MVRLKRVMSQTDSNLMIRMSNGATGYLSLKYNLRYQVSRMPDGALMLGTSNSLTLKHIALTHSYAEACEIFKNLAISAIIKFANRYDVSLDDISYILNSEEFNEFIGEDIRRITSISDSTRTLQRA